MNNIFRILYIFILATFTQGCSNILQTVDLKINSEDNSLQEEFNVIEKTLTIKEAQAQKNASYLRSVLQSGRGEDAQPIPEKIALISNFPKNSIIPTYKIGIGDTITFSSLVENNRSPHKILSEWPPQKQTSNYRLGIGDTIALTLMKDETALSQIAPINRSKSSDDDDNNLVINSQQNDIIMQTTGRIGSDGSVLLLEVGRLEANGRS